MEQQRLMGETDVLLYLAQLLDQLDENQRRQCSSSDCQEIFERKKSMVFRFLNRISASGIPDLKSSGWHYKIQATNDDSLCLCLCLCKDKKTVYDIVRVEAAKDLSLELKPIVEWLLER